MSRCCWRLALVLWSGLLVQTVEAQPFGMSTAPRALCVTDPYGIPFHSWYGSPIAYNSYFSMPFGGAYSSLGYSGTTNGFFWGGVPAVASATTPEWVVQRTSVFPLGTYSPWLASPRPLSSPRLPGIGKQNRPAISNETTRQGNDPHSSQDSPIQQVSGELPPPDELDQRVFAEGDRLLHDGEYARAYLRYLSFQREAGDRGAVYFRQAFALVAMGRYSHAVAKLKRGLQVEPDFPSRVTAFDEAFGIDNTDQRKEILKQAARWTNAGPRDPDRLFLMGVLLHFENDPKSSELFDTAWKLTDHRQHLQAFR